MGKFKAFIQKRHFYNNEEEYVREYINTNKRIAFIEDVINKQMHTYNTYEEVKEYFESKEVNEMMNEVDTHRKRLLELEELFQKYN